MRTAYRLLFAEEGSFNLERNAEETFVAPVEESVAAWRVWGDTLFYYVYGLFKVAVIGQQIYKRFKDGHTKDPRFAGLIFLVTAGTSRARAALDAGTV